METATIFSGVGSERWRAAGPDLWSYQPLRQGWDPALPIAKTLLDQPRWIEARYLYDELGSQLFERICELPDYYLTRTEASILARRARTIISTARPDFIVELGAGSAHKTRYLLTEQVRQLKGGVYVPIDVNLASLAESRASIASCFPQIRFQGLHGSYQESVAALNNERRKLIVFLGSTVGNLTLVEFRAFFNHVAAFMRTGDFLLLGVDRIKDRSVLEKAYNDPAGITARFILNAFEHINVTTGSGFDLSRLSYLSFYNVEWNQMEMYAIARQPQEVWFPSLKTGFLWETDEPVLAEISRKFDPFRLQQQLQVFGLQSRLHFTDSKEWFSLLLVEKAGQVPVSGPPKAGR